MGVWSFRQFYIRRALRLLPALYVVLGSVLVLGYFFYLPGDYALLSQSALSSLLFSANIFFWKNSGGYFSPNAEEMPFLHVWSLSVEEQFYFVWPFLFFLICKIFELRGRRLFVLLLVFLSFCLAEIGVASDYSGAYFLLPFRAGELLLGSLLALSLEDSRYSGFESKVLANGIAVAGMALILASAIFLDESSSFPGVNAFFPCVGAALVIVAPLYGQNFVSCLLSTRSLVFVGLISYSLYLWHWPVVSLLRYLRVDLTPIVMFTAIALSIFLGFLSWRFVESFFRSNASRDSRIVFFLATPVFLIVSFGPILIYLKDGLPGRFPYALLTQEELNNERQRYWQGIKTIDTDFTEGGGTKKVLLVGNSHANDLSYSLTENDFQGKIKLIGTTHYCFNFGFGAVFSEKVDHCRERFSAVIGSPELRSADVIYLHDNWGGKDFDGLVRVLQMIRSVTTAPIYVIGPKMIFEESALNISKYAQQDRFITPLSINKYSRRFQRKDLVDYDNELKEFFDRDLGLASVQYVSALDAQCGVEMNCDILSEDTGEYLYFDAGHFTLAGAKIFGKKLKERNSFLF
ncbi:peptidoglycan/LPS O-acetylase OafA/YrhL [Azotobacter chroococcum]|uniref:Peptidoglycan/LPS O-acetylase OafA/YrhL n=2 Tax=Azotobacter chroococcum TaxID=353 RepID=A0A4R1PKB5_9GAMM|nr:peptidoglycan/LPS O-acetylase OafA/YrhL [Azotobacter chroococcum]